MSDDISNYDLQKYINQALSNEVITQYENKILEIMKYRQEKYPSEKNNNEWLEFSNFIYNRRNNE